MQTAVGNLLICAHPLALPIFRPTRDNSSWSALLITTHNGDEDEQVNRRRAHLLFAEATARTRARALARPHVGHSATLGREQKLTGWREASSFSCQVAIKRAARRARREVQAPMKAHLEMPIAGHQVLAALNQLGDTRRRDYARAPDPSPLVSSSAHGAVIKSRAPIE